MIGAHQIRLNVGYDREEGPSLAVAFSIKSYEWKSPWSIDEFKRSLEAACARHAHEISVRYSYSHGAGQEEDEDFTDVYLELSYGNSKAKIVDAIGAVRSSSEKICSEAANQLAANMDGNSLTVYFNFAPPMRAACSQYMVYFSQFLRDLGIEADSQLKEEASRILFSVVPRDGRSALTRIKDALSIYVSLPAASDLYQIEQSDTAVAQLQATVLHFRAQMLLATATIAAQQKTIQVLEDRRATTRPS